MSQAFFKPGTTLVSGLFPTPLVAAQIESPEKLNAALTASILAREEVERGIVVSNQGGWHSKEFQSWCGPDGMFLLDAAQDLVAQMTVMQDGQEFLPARVNWRITAWANVNRQDDSNRPHAHPGAFWSGVYWVDDGGAYDDPELGGMFEIADPRGIMPSMYAPHLRYAVKDCLGDGQGQTITPQAGTLILFPSWLIHSVTSYKGQRPRISVAFNFSLGHTGSIPLKR